MGSRNQDRKIIAFISISFVACVAWILIAVGLEVTPYTTLDSAGRPMGFNDHLSFEHYGILLRSLSLNSIWQHLEFYDWLLLAMHVAAIPVVIFQRQFARYFFLGQIALFPMGCVGFILVPFLLLAITGGQADRETFTDFFPVHGVWMMTSLYGAFASTSKRQLRRVVATD